MTFLTWHSIDVATFQNGLRLGIARPESIAHTEESRAQALAQYGTTEGTGVAGAFNRLDRTKPVVFHPETGEGISLDGIMYLSKEGAVSTTPQHEHFHFAWQYLITDRERAALTKQYGSEEGAALAYERWAPAEQPHSIFGKILQVARGVYQRFANPTAYTAEQAFTAGAQGEWGQRNVRKEMLPGEQLSGDAYSVRRTGHIDTIDDLIEIAKSEPLNNKAWHDYRVVDANEATRIESQSGLPREVDLTGYKHSIDAIGIRHIFNGHGELTETNPEQRPVTDDDIKLIPDITATYDTVKYVGKNENGLDVLRYTKRINGKIYYFEEVRTGRKKLASKTLYAQSSKAASPAPDATLSKENSLGSHVQNAPGSTATENDTTYAPDVKPDGTVYSVRNDGNEKIPVDYERLDIDPYDVKPPHAPREKDKLAEITDSMKEVGWNGRPLVVVDMEDYYQAVTGSHRLAAAKKAGLETVPVVAIKPRISDSRGYDPVENVPMEESVVERLLSMRGDEEKHRVAEEIGGDLGRLIQQDTHMAFSVRRLTPEEAPPPPPEELLRAAERYAEGATKRPSFEVFKRRAAALMAKTGLTFTEEEMRRAFDLAYQGRAEVAKGEMLAERQDVPPGEQAPQAFGYTVAGSPVTPGELSAQLVNNPGTYERLSDEQSLNNAQDTIRRVGDVTRAVDHALDVTGNRQLTKNDIAVGEEGIRDAINRGDHLRAAEITARMADILTNAGQVVQAASIMKRLTPEGMLLFAERRARRIMEATHPDGAPPESNVSALPPAQAMSITETMRGRQSLQQAETQGVEAYRAALEEALNGSDLFTPAQRSYLLKSFDSNVARSRTPLDNLSRYSDRMDQVMLGKVAKLMADMEPATLGEKMKGLQRISMLLNLRTNVRNIMGNAIMTGVGGVADTVALPIDVITSIISGQRTTTGPKVGAYVKGFVKGAVQAVSDFRLGVDTTKSTLDKYETTNKRVFDNRFLNWAERTTGFLLTLGDKPFYQAVHDQALADYMKTRGLTEATPEAEEFATQVALEKTFQDTNAISKAFVGIRDNLNFQWGFGAGNIVIPFAKTPANIVARALDYSVGGAYVTARELLHAAIRNPSKPFDQQAFVSSLSKSLTGAGILWAGYLLAQQGLITGAADENRRRAQYLAAQGRRPYSFLINGKAISYDWAQPASMLLAMGANIYQSTHDRDKAANMVRKAIISGGDTLFNLSLMQGMRNVFGGRSDSPTESWLDTIAEFPLQFEPTIMGQVARTIDPVQRDTSSQEFARSLPAMAKSRVPELSKQLPAKVDVRGGTMRYEGGAFGQFVSPANVSTIKSTPIDVELNRLYDATGNTQILPMAAPKSIRNDGVTYKLPPAERQQYQRVLANQVGQALQTAMRYPEYAQANDNKRAEILQYAVSQAANAVREQYIAARWQQAGWQRPQPSLSIPSPMSEMRKQLKARGRELPRLPR